MYHQQEHATAGASLMVSKGKKRIRAPAKVRQQRVLTAAVTEFLKHGYSGASIDNIARRAGVSKPTIYRWHTNKERLFVAAALSLLDYPTEMLKSLPDDTRQPDVVLREAARKWLTSYLRPQMRGLVRLSIAEAQRFPAIAAEIFARTNRELYKPLATYLSKLAAKGVIQNKNLELTANIFGILAVLGYRFMYTEPKNTEADFAHIDTIVDVFLNGCLTHHN